MEQGEKETRFSVLLLTKGALTLSFALSPARFIAAAAAAALASIVLDAPLAVVWATAVGAGRGVGAAVFDADEEEGVDACDGLDSRRDMADLDADAASDEEAGAGVPVREEVGVQACEVVCLCGGQKEWPQLCWC